jgi:hypothetical protein
MKVVHMPIMVADVGRMWRDSSLLMPWSFCQSVIASPYLEPNAAAPVMMILPLKLSES